MLDKIKLEYIEQYEEQLSSIEKELRNFSGLKYEIQKLTNYINDYNKKNFFQKKKFNKEYLKFKSELEKYLNYIDQNKLEDQILEIKEHLMAKKEDLVKLSKSKSLSEMAQILNISVNTILDRYKQNPSKYAFSIEDKDNVINQNNNGYKDIDELVLVHKTSYAPSGDVLNSPIQAKAEITESFSIMNELKEVKYEQGRDTIHFCLNCEVSSHLYGNFDNRKYAVVLPFNDKLILDVKCLNPVDTYFNNSVSTKGGYILCPIEEYDLISERNKETIIIPYNGKTVDGYANLLVNYLGYRLETAGMWSWSDSAPNNINKINKKYGINGAPHSSSKESEEEKKIQAINRSNAVMKIIIDEFLKEKINPVELFNDFENYFMDLYIEASYHYLEKRNELKECYYTDRINFFKKLVTENANNMSEENKNFWIDLYNQKFHLNFDLRQNDCTIYNRLLFINKLNEVLPDLSIEQLLQYKAEYENSQKESENRKYS